MDTRTTLAKDNFQALDSRFMMRCFYVFATFAALSIGISAGGKALGRSIVLAGHTDDASLNEIVIGNNVLAIPANAIRFERARRDGVAERLDLYLHWPEMTGYTQETRDDFNSVRGARKILFLSFAEKMMTHDMSGRFEPIYRSLIAETGTPLGDGVVEHRFTERSGYLDETLIVAEQAGGEPFVARCLSGSAAEESSAPCERDIHLGQNLSLSYRFPRELLRRWRDLDAAVRVKASEYLQTGRLPRASR